MDGSTGNVVNEDGQSVKIVEEGMKLQLVDWEVEILEVLPDAKFTGSGYIKWDSVGSAPAAF
ncbi:MAG TPA: hypothetical protein ENI20_15310, partial [Bacteroides sp.]|nr:hypothetical protein [Bacteroides sp.]